MLEHGLSSLVFGVFPQIWCLGWSHGALRGRAPREGGFGGAGLRAPLTSSSRRPPFSTRSGSPRGSALVPRRASPSLCPQPLVSPAAGGVGGGRRGGSPGWERRPPARGCCSPGWGPCTGDSGAAARTAICCWMTWIALLRVECGSPVWGCCSSDCTAAPRRRVRLPCSGWGHCRGSVLLLSLRTVFPAALRSCGSPR